jgi:ankyrin repeat protein
MEKRIVVVVVAFLFAQASAYAQTTDLGVVIGGTPQDVQAAIDKGADVNARSGSETPLILAAWHNPNPDVITTLLRAGADIEARDLVYGGTALQWAAGWNPNPEVITTLLSAGADGKAKSNEGKTAFDYAQYNEKLKGTAALRQLQEASQ